MTYKLLLVDDDPMVKETVDLIIENEFSDRPVQLDWVQSGELAFKAIRSNPNKYALVIMDYDLASKRGLTDEEKKTSLNGLETAKAILKKYPQTQIVMQSGDKTRELIKDVLNLQIFDFIDKPIVAKRLKSVIETYLYKYDKFFRTHERVLSFNDEYKSYISTISPDIVGQSKAMFDICKRIESLNQSTSRILIYGENGTGKELIAQAIHANSPRSNMPFIATNIAAISESLIESELFGHKKGSFTGATGDKKGKFLLADGGTIFLDEIGELPLHLQAKLLRVLQQNELEVVGGEKPKSFDARVICATNRDLEQMVQDGLFREDLYFRINVVPLQIPSLRERKEDIPLLIDHAIEKHWPVEKLLKNSSYELLKEYSWPGNIRELLNLFERLGTYPSNIISSEHLDVKILKESELNSNLFTVSDLSMEKLDVTDLNSFENWTELIEKRIIEKQLTNFKNIRDAATGLNIPYSKLFRRVKKFNINCDDLFKKSKKVGAI